MLSIPNHFWCQALSLQVLAVVASSNSAAGGEGGAGATLAAEGSNSWFRHVSVESTGDSVMGQSETGKKVNSMLRRGDGMFRREGQPRRAEESMLQAGVAEGAVPTEEEQEVEEAAVDSEPPLEEALPEDAVDGGAAESVDGPLPDPLLKENLDLDDGSLPDPEKASQEMKVDGDAMALEEAAGDESPAEDANEEGTATEEKSQDDLAQDEAAVAEGNEQASIGEEMMTTDDADGADADEGDDHDDGEVSQLQQEDLTSDEEELDGSAGRLSPKYAGPPEEHPGMDADAAASTEEHPHYDVFMKERTPEEEEAAADAAGTAEAAEEGMTSQLVTEEDEEEDDVGDDELVEEGILEEKAEEKPEELTADAFPDAEEAPAALAETDATEIDSMTNSTLLEMEVATDESGRALLSNHKSTPRRRYTPPTALDKAGTKVAHKAKSCVQQTLRELTQATCQTACHAAGMKGTYSDVTDTNKAHGCIMTVATHGIYRYGQGTDCHWNSHSGVAHSGTTRAVCLKQPFSCVWRDTSGCNANGPRRPTHDLPCSTTVAKAKSGWCDCNANGVLDEGELGYGCDASPGKCDTVCKMVVVLEAFVEHRRRRNPAINPSSALTHFVTQAKKSCLSHNKLEGKHLTLTQCKKKCTAVKCAYFARTALASPTSKTFCYTTTSGAQNGHGANCQFSVYKSDMHLLHHKGKCLAGSPCTACQGDCDSDDQCAGSLKCFQRDGHLKTPPGCYKGGTGDKNGEDYCYKAPAATSTATQNMLKDVTSVVNSGGPKAYFTSRRRRTRRRRGVSAQACNVISNGPYSMICPPTFTLVTGTRGVCHANATDDGCKDWGRGDCDPRAYVLPNGLHWPHTTELEPKSKIPHVIGGSFKKTKNLWKTNGVPTTYCQWHGGTPDLLPITSCWASTNEDEAKCEEAFDGMEVSKTNGWKYNSIKDSWVDFNLEEKSSIARVDVLTGVGMSQHHITDFKLFTKHGTKYTGCAGLTFLNAVPTGSKITGDHVKLQAKKVDGIAWYPQRIDLSFTPRHLVEAVRVQVHASDATDLNGQLTEILLYRHTGCQDIALVPGTQLLNAEYWKFKCKSVPSAAYMIQVEMGLVTDTFKPMPGETWCSMLTHPNKHVYSPDYGYSWKTPAFASSHFGGSMLLWPKNTSHGDLRSSLSFWGSTDNSVRGGCCYDNYDAHHKSSWHQAFSMRWCEMPVGVNPPCTTGSVHQRDSSGNTKLGCYTCEEGYYDDGTGTDMCTKCHGSARRRRATTCTKEMLGYERIGPGVCHDAEGNPYNTFEKAGCETEDECKAGCELFHHDECHGVTFRTIGDCGRCELRMEADYTLALSGWVQMGTGNKGRGHVTSSEAGTADKDMTCHARRKPEGLDNTTLMQRMPSLGWTCPGAISVRGFHHQVEYNGIYHMMSDLRHGVPWFSKVTEAVRYIKAHPDATFSEIHGVSEEDKHKHTKTEEETIELHQSGTEVGSKRVEIIIQSDKDNEGWTIGVVGGPEEELATCDQDNFAMQLDHTSCFTDEGRCAFQEWDGHEHVGINIKSLSAQAACESDNIFLLPVPEDKCPPDLELPRCDAVKAGEMCEGDGECGTDDSLDNCYRYDIYYKQAPYETTTTTPGAIYVSAGFGEPECPHHYVRIRDFPTCLEAAKHVHPDAHDGILPPYEIGRWPSEPRGCYVKTYPDGIRRFVHLNDPPVGGAIHLFQTLLCKHKDAPLIEKTPDTPEPCEGKFNNTPPE